MDKRIKLPFGELKGAHLLNILIGDESCMDGTSWLPSSCSLPG
jgi:hypothetical protein